VRVTGVSSRQVEPGSRRPSQSSRESSVCNSRDRGAGGAGPAGRLVLLCAWPQFQQRAVLRHVGALESGVGGVGVGAGAHGGAGGPGVPPGTGRPPPPLGRGRGRVRVGEEGGAAVVELEGRGLGRGVRCGPGQEGRCGAGLGRLVASATDLSGWRASGPGEMFCMMMVAPPADTVAETTASPSARSLCTTTSSLE
jgi:hypothetical protein